MKSAEKVDILNSAKLSTTQPAVKRQTPHNNKTKEISANFQTPLLL